METIETTLKNYDELIQKIKEHLSCDGIYNKSNFSNFEITLSNDKKILNVRHWWQYAGCHGNWYDWEIPVDDILETKGLG